MDLTLLVDAKDDGFVRRIQIKANNIVQFLDKLFVAAELESLDQVRLEVRAELGAADRSFAA